MDIKYDFYVITSCAHVRVAADGTRILFGKRTGTATNSDGREVAGDTPRYGGSDLRAVVPGSPTTTATDCIELLHRSPYPNRNVLLLALGAEKQ